MFRNLLAKSFEESLIPACTLPGHSLDVLLSASFLTSLLEQDIKSQFSLNTEQYFFVESTIRLAAYLHDWGKANSCFQSLLYCLSKIDKSLRQRIRACYGTDQLIRHEFLSAILVLKVGKIYDWLRSKYSEEQIRFAIAAVIGHHLRAEAGKILELGTGLEIEVFLGHKDFGELLEIGEQYLGLAKPPKLANVIWTRDEINAGLSTIVEKLQGLENLDFDQQICLALVKAGVVAADLAGSTGISDSWLENALTQTLITTNELDELITQKLKGMPLRPFQVEVGESQERVTIVNAGCGLGKTVAAYLWAKRWADRRLFFCYPTTGTATQGFLDYAAQTPIEKALIHSRAAVDREILLNGEADDPALDAQEALQTWSKKLVIATADHILGIIQNQRRSLFGWVALTQGAFVFDEVHAYDSRLFGALLQFIRVFRGAPILLMSASLNSHLVQAIQSAAGQTKIISGSQDLERLKRYQLLVVAKETEIWDKVEDALQRQEKILWVANTVRTSVAIYEQAKERFSSANVLIYHSRYRYKDRVEKQQEVVAAFRSSGAVLCVATQVCEISLDINADLLISAIAPAPALIQRFGRCNRYMVFGDSPKQIILYDPGESFPYSQREMETGRQFIEELVQWAGTTVSQADLAAVLVKMPTEGIKLLTGAWIGGGWQSHPHPLRQENSILAILAGDKMQIETEATLKQQTSGRSFEQCLYETANAWAIPLPPIKGCWGWKRLKNFLIAPATAVSYCSEKGAKIHAKFEV